MHAVHQLPDEAAACAPSKLAERSLTVRRMTRLHTAALACLALMHGMPSALHNDLALQVALMLAVIVHRS